MHSIRRLFWILPAVFLLGRCGDAPIAPPSARPGPDLAASGFGLTNATDINPDPRVVEINLEARMGDWEISPGRRVRAMT